MSIERAAEDPRSREAERFFRLNIALKGLLAALKVFAGIVTGSGALLADGWHNLADLLTGLVAWISFRYAGRPPDADHHYGHGNAEALAGLFVGLVLLVTGAGVCWQAVVWKTSLTSNVHGIAAVGIATVSLVVNELLARRSFRLGWELSSQGLIALARDDRADALSSALVVVGVVGSLIGWQWAEPVVTGAIGIWIVVMGLKSGREGLNVLMDRVPDPKLRQQAQSIAADVEGVVEVQAVRIHPLGTHDRIDMEISVDGALAVRDGHRIAHAVETAIRESMERVTEVHVHVNPT